MKTKQKRITWELVIETNMYAGNFERELCAYATGATGCCGVGSNLVDDKIANMFYEYVDTYYHMDDNESPCGRPVTMVSIEVDANTSDSRYEFYGVNIGFSKKPTEKMLNLIVTRSKEFADGSYGRELKILKVYLLKKKVLTDTKRIWEEKL